MEAFCGSWKLKDSGDLEPIANRLGVSIPLKDIAELLNSIMRISPVGDGYSMQISNGAMTYEMKYKLGEEFDHASLDGRPLKTKVTLEGKTLKQVDKGDKLMTMESVVEGNTLTMTARLEELVCVRRYTRI
uniref:Fatty acid binding protein n=1 Tax=Spirometra erinaceieuropaei TaxID=99802 RepID=A0A0F6MV41_SPIER|nr:fatty acid binding protein [Spirometra erinaceieuropaei]